MQFRSKLIIFALFIMAPLKGNEPYVIGCRESGLFSNFLQVLNHIWWCKRIDATPIVYWNERTSYYQPEGYNGATNAWEYYFKPVSSLPYDTNYTVHSNFEPDDQQKVGYGQFLYPWMPLRFGINKDNIRQKAHVIVKEHIALNDATQTKVDAFYNAHLAGRKTIGIHLRGTDKKYEMPPIPVEQLIDIANQLPGDQFFVASDEKKLIDYAIAHLNRPVFFLNAHRSTDGKPIHYCGTMKEPARIGEEVVLDAFILARCHTLLHTGSCVALSVLFINPDIKNAFIDYALMYRGTLPKLINGED